VGEVSIEARSGKQDFPDNLLPRWWKAWLPSVFLIVVCLAVYYPVHDFDFFNIDDGIYVYQNPHVLGPLNWSTVTWAFTHSFARNYDPLTFLAHNLDVKLFGTHPGAHHEVNVVLHALDTVLLFWLLSRATGFAGRSFMVAALFALHPINVENVAWVSELKTLLSAAFFFLALGAYHWYARRPLQRRMAIVALLYGLGLLAKPQVITLPFVLLLWDYWPLGRMFAADPNVSRGTRNAPTFQARRLSVLIREKMPLFIIAAGDAVITMFAEHKAEEWPYTFSIRLGNGILSYARYIGKLFWPLHLSYLYPHPGYSLRWGQVWGALFLLIAVSAFVIARRHERYLLVGWFWFVGTMVPVIGLVQIDLPALADRWAYIGFVGLFVMICWGVAEWADAWRLPKPVLPLASAAVLIILTLLTYRQVEYWRDSLTIWTHSLEVTHRNWVADMNIGFFLQQKGQSEEALAHWQRAAEDQPTNADISLNVAFLEHQRGDLRQAIQYYEKVLAVSKTASINAQVLANMGHAYSALGDEARAKQCYLEAERVRQLPPPPPPPQPIVKWDGDWWHLGSFLRERLQYFLSSH
jgi:tetratricopeptide (TPR) repeat protein